MIPEITNNPPQPTVSKQSKLYKLFKPDKPSTERSERVSSFFFYLTILFFFIGFNFSDVMVGNWYQQWMPELNGRTISDIFFLDSLTGYAVTNNLTPNDTGYILKTTTSGDNWYVNIILNRNLTTVKFINSNTGFVCGGSGGGTAYLYKTTNSGANWNIISTPGATSWRGLSLVDEDTIWLVDDDSFVGGVFRTTNGGANWDQQLNIGSSNPNHIYMFNGRLGFIAEDNVYLRRTTNSGLNWTVVNGAGGFQDMYFIDSLTGWKTSFQKTTDGGLNWVNQVLPQGGIIQFNNITNFSNINKDTIWANGGFVIFPNNQVRSILNRTTNGGDTWKFQIPDTSIINNIVYYYVNFDDKRNGWATDNNPLRGEIHTTNGGDTTFLTGLQQLSNEIPKNFKLFQNYPNPFNPNTKIGFQIPDFGSVTLKVFDITGKELAVLVDKELRTGTYEVDWNAADFSSGVYFYKLTVTTGKEVFRETKRMVLIK
ncbi:MAG: T9SS type A sorting domain-containing protein [Ignavibacteria bacterium]|nr:T9SS type A sorting domain-containing protein [Ignavibacteria bacterium]